MNERIKELAKQAGGNPNYKAFHGHFLPPPPDYIDPATVDLEKFAELIVQECIEVIKPCNCGCASKTEVVLTECIIVEIKEHFGVEE